MSITHILLIAVVALILFGPNKLPELGRALGKTLRDFKKGANDLMSDIHTSEPEKERKDITPPAEQAVPLASQGPDLAKRPSPQEGDKPKDSRRLPE
ncbi:Sec-independent protein translocase subunit TatA/TatB [Paenibacillus agricola]|uniref:Sec-independent protein translocase protein TatA n=1 Tax=Paenibacillus agricola TaxID=2716264 RepID=A0ABX0JER3_9BACL|nr:twin-arginine translocase TatA/TatE family subunit [Paenibacillus agricola]NHN34251.1 twin-arginine translocase TatA/TatE family subunit [Paenibacillus agricola]